MSFQDPAGLVVQVQQTLASTMTKTVEIPGTDLQLNLEFKHTASPRKIRSKPTEAAPAPDPPSKKRVASSKAKKSRR